MDIDPNDLLSTNVFISKPDLNPNVSLDSNEEFKRYYEKELQKKTESKIQAAINKIELKDVNHSEENDDNNILNTNTFTKNSQDKDKDKQIERFTRETKTLVSIDSRDRIKKLYPKPNNFKMFLGKTFTNVKKIEMVSLEFPNTDAVINTGNNKIYWINQEDIDLDITVNNEGVISYPIYSVELRTGSYTTATLQNEIIAKMNAVRRKQGSSNGNTIIGDYHYFVASLDVDTDIVTLTSLTLQQMPNNPFSTSIGSGVISVGMPEHGFSTYDMVYIVGAKAIAGITGSVLNGFHQITVINANLFTFEVNIKAADTAVGGGNTVKTGLKAPFQLWWGEESFTVAQNIGFPLENSSQLIKTNVSDIQNFHQMTINLVESHGFLRTYDYIGQTINIGYIVAGNFIVYRTYTITEIPGPNKLLVSVPDNTVADLLNNNIQAVLLRFNDLTFNVVSYETYNIQSIILTTFTDHNYTLNNIGETISLSETVDPRVVNDVSYDGDYVLYGVPSSNTLIIRGVIAQVNTHINPIYGTLPRQTPITTWTVPISQITKNFIQVGGLYYTKVETNVPHKLNLGDSVMFNNVRSNPILTTSSYPIISILDNTTFLIQQELVSLDTSTIEQGNAFLGTGLITVSFPSHGFNKIVSISNGTPFDTIVNDVIVSNLPIVVSTLNPHYFSIGDIVRFTGTNTTPSLDEGGYIVYTIDEDDTFSIIRTPNSFVPVTTPTTATGIVGLNHDFYLYDLIDVGGIPKTSLNGVKFTVRDIIDENTFTFMAPGLFATSTEQGGGEYVFISSLFHGFNGIQRNTKNGILNRSINLQGEDYCFLTCPQLDTMLNTGSVKNIFARISLDQPPGYVCFKFLSNPKHFNVMPLDKLTELDFSITNYGGSLYDFNDLDFSFTLEITEVNDATKSFNISSRRGITDSS